MKKFKYIFLMALLSCFGMTVRAQVQANIFASELKASAVSATNEVNFSYTLNADAESVTITVSNGDEFEITETSDLTKGQHTVTRELTVVEVGDYTWSVTAVGIAANTNTGAAPVQFTNSADPLMQFYSVRGGLAIDNNMDSPLFGRIYVGESLASGTSGVAPYNTEDGIYILNAALQDVTGQGKTSYKGGLNLVRNGVGGTDLTPARITLTADGKLFIPVYWGAQSLEIMDPANPGDNWTTAFGDNSVLDHPLQCHFVGNDLYVLGNSGAEGSISRNDFNIKKYENFSVGHTDAATFTIPMPAHSNGLGTMTNILGFIPDSKGGWWVASGRGQDDGPALMHFLEDGTCDINLNYGELGNGSISGVTLVYFEDKSELVVGIATNIRIYTINWTGDSPELGTYYTLPAFGGTASTGIVFDLANNYYIVSTSSERLTGWALPLADASENTFTTFAPASNPVKVTKMLSEVYEVIVVDGEIVGAEDHFAPGAVVEIIADNKIAEFKMFKEWDFSVDVTFDEGFSKLDESTQFIMPEEDVTATAIYDDLKTGFYPVIVTVVGEGSFEIDPADAQQEPYEAVTLTAIPDEGYKFVKWTVTAGDVELDDETALEVTFDMPAEIVRITAEFEPNVWTVTFMSNGSTHLEIPDVTNGEPVERPANPVRTGYAFGGWFTDMLFTEMYDFNDFVTGNLTLYAKWAEQGALQSLWNKTFSGNSGDMHRDIAVYNGKLYLARNSAADIRVIDGADGTELTAEDLPCTNYGFGIAVDNAGNLLVPNNTGGAVGWNLRSVNIASGTQAAITGFENVTARSEFLAARGDIGSATENSYVIAAENGTGTGIKAWEILNGARTSTPPFYYTRTEGGGTGADITWIDDTRILVTGQNVIPKIMTVDFNANPFITDIQPIGAAIANASGGVSFNLGGIPYVVYPDGNATTARQGPVAIYKITNPASPQKIGATTPVLGSDANASVHVAIHAEKISDHEVMVYVWAPNNGAAAYKVEAVSDPVLSHAPGMHSSAGLTLAITVDAGVEARYTLDGSTPTLESPLYTAPIELEEGKTTVTILSTKDGLFDNLLSATYDVADKDIFTVTFDYNYAGAELITEDIFEDHLITKPQDPVREDYNFLGWFTAGGVVWNFNDGVTDNVTLYAKWWYSPEFTPENYPDLAPEATTVDEYLFTQLGATVEVDGLPENIKRAIQRDGKLYLLHSVATDPTISIYDAEDLTFIGDIDKTGISCSSEAGALAISDIGFTSDGKLLACIKEFTVNVSTVRQFKIYIWDNDAAAPELYYITKDALPASNDNHTANWSNAWIGETMAVSGPSWNSTIFLSAVSQSGTFAGAMRFLVITKYNDETTIYWYGEANANALYSEKTWGTNYQFVTSPLDENRFIVTSQTSDDLFFAEFEFSKSTFNTSETTTAVQLPLQTIQTGSFAEAGGYELFKTNGVNFFRYGGKAYMAAPVADEGRVNAGVALFDITDGIDNAVKVSDKYPEEGLGEDAAPYMMAYGTIDGDKMVLGVLAENQGYARFIEDVVYVTFDAKNGSDAIVVKVVVGDKVVQPTEPVRAGYRFDGWFTEEVDGDEYDFEAAVDENISLFAYWTELFTVTFDLAYDSKTETQEVANGEMAVIPDVPERFGYRFDGWFIDDDEFDFETPITENITLVAEWTLTGYFVTFDTQGGSDVDAQIHTEGDKAVKPTDPTRTGFLFVGWFTEATGDNEWDFDTEIDDHVILYAVWSALPAAIVSVDPQGDQTISPRPIVRIEFSGELDEASLDDAITVKDQLGNTIAGVQTYKSINGKSVLHYLFNDDLTPNVKYTVTVGTDIENEGGLAVLDEDFEFSFVNKQREITAAPVVLHAFNSSADNWQVPSYSGSTGTSIINGSTTAIDASTLATTNNTGSLKMTYQWNSAHVGDPLIRVHNTGTSPTFTAEGKIIQYYLFGDGSGTQFRLCLRSSAGAGSIWCHTPVVLDFVGWKLITWDLENDPLSYFLVNNADPFGTTTLVLSCFGIDPAPGQTLNYTTPTSVWVSQLQFVSLGSLIASYVISFDTQGGSLIDAISMPEGEKITRPANPTFGANVFMGWYKDAACTEGNEWDFATDVVTGTMTLYAKWLVVEAGKFAVSFDDGINLDIVTVDENTPVTKPTDPVRFGYQFDGWFTSDDVEWVFTDDVTENIVLTAKWSIKYFTVTFDSNEGSAVAPASVQEGTPVTQPSNPAKAGHTFAGWFADDEFTTQWVFTTAVTEAITLYAKWTVNTYTVTFNSNGGGSVAPFTVTYGEKVTEPSAPTRGGYDFAGWFTPCAGEDCELTDEFDFDAEYLQTSGITLYAKWVASTPIYAVRFNTQGGTEIATQDLAKGSLVTKPEDPERTGYTFVSWFSDEALTTEWNFATGTVELNFTLYAKWTANTYTVAFNSKGGSAVSNATVAYGELLTQPADPTYSGFSFAGWFKDENYSQQWFFAINTVTSDITLYAKWVTSITGVEVADAIDFKVYPNPTEGIFTLAFEEFGTYVVTITDMSGKVVMRQTVSDQISQMDISGLSAGVYLLLINDGEHQSMTRIVKQ